MTPDDVIMTSLCAAHLCFEHNAYAKFQCPATKINATSSGQKKRAQSLWDFGKKRRRRRKKKNQNKQKGFSASMRKSQLKPQKNWLKK